MRNKENEMKVIERIQDNVAKGYSKTYGSFAAAERSIAKAEAKLNMKIEWFPIAHADGRFSIAIPALRCVDNDPQQRGREMMKIAHGTTGWFCFN